MNSALEQPDCAEVSQVVEKATCHKVCISTASFLGQEP